MEHSPVSPRQSPLSALLPANAGIEPLIAVTAALRGFNREQLGSAVEVLIAFMDAVDGDPDIEDATDVEDDFALSPNAQLDGIGCDISDPGDQAWIEWHTMRGSQKGGPNILAGQEDDEEDDAPEEDDPAGQCDEDGINTGGMQFSPSGPGCLISDPQGDEVEPVPALDWGEDQTKGPLPVFPGVDRRLMAPHRNYIRAERCERFVSYGESFYQLRDRTGRLTRRGGDLI